MDFSFLLKFRGVSYTAHDLAQHEHRFYLLSSFNKFNEF